MRRFALLAGLALVACGSEPAALPPACDATPSTVIEALDRAPGPVRLDDDVLLSTCVERAREAGALTRVGSMLTPAAHALAGRRTARAAEHLGFLVGAAERGGQSGNGVQAQLVRRLEAVMASLATPTQQRAARRGARAGRDHG